MQSWPKLAWEVDDPGPEVGDRVLAQSFYDLGLRVEGTVVDISFDVMTASRVYHIRTDDGSVVKAFAQQVRRASLWETSPYRYDIGDKVRVRESLHEFVGTVNKRAIGSHQDIFYIVRDERGDPHVVDEDQIFSLAASASLRWEVEPEPDVHKDVPEIEYIRVQEYSNEEVWLGPGIRDPEVIKRLLGDVNSEPFVMFFKDGTHAAVDDVSGDVFRVGNSYVRVEIDAPQVEARLRWEVEPEHDIQLADRVQLSSSYETLRKAMNDQTARQILGQIGDVVHIEPVGRWYDNSNWEGIVGIMPDDTRTGETISFPLSHWNEFMEVT